MLKLIQINLYILYFIKASQQKQNLKINFIILTNFFKIKFKNIKFISNLFNKIYFNLS